MSKIIGIDFGTTKTIAAVLKDGVPTVIRDGKGRHSVPSMVLVTPEQEFAVGWEAKEHRRRYESRHVTINSIKRSLGREREKSWGWLHTYPQAVAALILGQMKIEVESSLGEEVNKAVIAIPAHYDINQRWAVKQAAEIAGFEVLRLINEATAAAFAYMAARSPKDTVLLVFDFGGGTLDVSVLDIGSGVCEVKATAGDGQLGGDDFDQLLIDYVLEKAREEFGEFTPLGPFQQIVLREAVVKAKAELSASTFAQIYVPGLIQTSAQSFQPLDITITRESFYQLSKDLFERTEAVLKRAIKESSRSRIEAALLVGGTSRIPAIRDLVRKTLGIEPYIGVDPETCVAQGAAVQAGILSGLKTDAFLLDTCPNALSIGTMGGVATRLIEKNTCIPTRNSMVFTTARDNQTEISVTIYEGDKPMANDNTLIGEVTLMGIAPAPRDMPQIEVTFDLDANSMLNVSAKDMSTGREAHTTVRAPFRLSPPQLELVKGIVDQEMAKIMQRRAHEQEQEREEEANRHAEALRQAIQDFLARRRNHLTAQQLSLLEGGAQLLTDYRERGSSTEDLRRLHSGLAREFENISCKLIARRVRKIVEGEQFARWAEEAAASLYDEESVQRSRKDFTTLNQSLIEPLLADLQASPDVYRTQEGVLAELRESPGARHCFGLIISSATRYALPDPKKFTGGAEENPLTESLCLILMYYELGADKPLKRREQAARLLAGECGHAHLSTLLNRVPDERDEVGQQHLMEVCARFPWDVWLREFFAASAETQRRWKSEPLIRPQLRAALTDSLTRRDESEQQEIRQVLDEIGDA